LRTHFVADSEQVTNAFRLILSDAKVKAILVFDSPQSIGSDLEGKRNQEIRSILGQVQVRSEVVDDATLQTDIPLAMASLASLRGGSTMPTMHPLSERRIDVISSTV
jgi:hypothetical protein